LDYLLPIDDGIRIPLFGFIAPVARQRGRNIASPVKRGH
jgi:hypothetical protein